MSDNLRDILGIGSKKMPIMSVPLVKGLTAAANEGANKGFWRIQLRDQSGNWVQMGGAVTFEVDLPDLGKVFGTGTYQGYSKENPNEIIIRVKDHPKLPDGDYSIPPDNLEESAEAIIPAGDLARLIKKDEGVSIEQMEAEAAQVEQAVPDLKDEITGDEAMQVVRNAGAEYAKSQGRFPMSRTYNDIKQGLRSQYSQLLEGIKQDSPELLKNKFIINEDGTGRTGDIETEEDFWGALTAMQVSTSSRWVSPKDINPLAKEVNRRYAEKFLGVKKDGLISFYRNVIQEKENLADAAAGYASLDRKMAWDYNPISRPADIARGRYIVKAKPDEVLGILGYSGAIDEFGVVISPEVTSLPGRFERVGGLEKQTIDTAPWVDPKLLDEWSREGGGGPFRFLAPMTNFDYYPLDSSPFGEEDTWASFIKTNNLPDKSVSKKYDEIYGAGSWEKDWKGNSPTARIYADLFVKFTDKDGKEKWGLNAPNLRNLSTKDMLNFAEPGDDFDRGIKLLSTMQELMGKPFFVNKGHSKEDPRLAEVEQSGESTPDGDVTWFDDEKPAQAASNIPYSAESVRARYLDPKNGGVFKLGDTIPVTDYDGNVTQHVVTEKDFAYDTVSRIVSEPTSSVYADPLVSYSRIKEGTPAHEFMSKWYEKNKGRFLHYNYRPLERLIREDSIKMFGGSSSEGRNEFNYATGMKTSIYRHIRYNRIGLHVEMFKEMAKTLPEYEWPKELSIFVERQKNIKALSKALPEARVSISIDGKAFLKVIADGRFKSQFETGASRGIYDITARSQLELAAMGAPLDLDPAKRPIYGNLVLPDLGRFDFIDMEYNIFRLTGFNTAGYGNVKVILKPGVKRRTTYTADDSLTAGVDSARPLTEEFTEESLLLSGISDYDKALPSSSRINSDYFETQIHNGVTLDDIEKIVIAANFETSGRAVPRSATRDPDKDKSYAEQTFSDLTKALKDKGLDIPIQLVEDESEIVYPEAPTSEQSGVDVPGGDVEFFDDSEKPEVAKDVYEVKPKVLETDVTTGDVNDLQNTFAIMWTGNDWYKVVNKYLRFPEEITEEDRKQLPDIELVADQLTQATKNNKFKKDQVLLRRVGLRSEDLKVGDIIEDAGFQATTKSSKIGTNVGILYEPFDDNFTDYKIYVKKGQPGLDLEKASLGAARSEQEVLLPPGTKFRVLSVSEVPHRVEGMKGNTLVEVEIVSTEDDVKEQPTKPEGSGLTVNGRSQLREIKRRLGGEIFDTTAIKLIEQYSGSDDDVKKLDAALFKKGIYRKRDLSTDTYVDAVRSAISDYKKIDPNLNIKREAKKAEYGSLNGTGLGVIGYLQAGTLTKFDNFDFSYASDKDKLSAAREEIIKNGFVNPITILYNQNRDDFSLENPEDSLKILATREIKDPDIKIRAIPTVVKVSAESDSFDKDTELNPVFFYELSQPSAWVADIQVKPEEYYDLSGIDSLPVPSRTDAEKEAIDFYQRGTYLTLKKYLADPSSAGDDAEKLGKIVDTLNKLGNSEKLPANTELFRGFRLSADSDLYKYYSSLKPGDVLADPNRFGSTSLDPIVAEDFATLGGKKDDYTGSVVLEISTEEGATGIAFGDNEDTYASGVEVALASEKEVLLPFAAELKINKIFKDSDGILRIQAKYGKKVELESKSDATDQDFIDFSSFEKVSGRLGHTDGGKYKDPKTGKEYYVKIQDGKRGANEALASALYNEAGIDSIRVKNGVLNDTPITYTEWRDDLAPISERISKITSDDPALDGFAIDAWLANWDTVGAGDFGGYNNISYDKDGNPVRIDAGGALLYRGAGLRKGSTFGNEVGELETFKNTNFTTGELFSKITYETELASVDRLRKITPERIDELVDQYVSDSDDNKELKDKLKARREFILSKYEPTSEAEQSDESDPFDEVEWFDDIEQPAPTSKVLDSLLKDGIVNLDAAPDSTILSNFKKDEIPLEQKNALFYYLGPQYRSFNNFLRFGDEDGSDKVPDIEQKIKDLDALIESRGNVETESFVYRGMIELPKFEDTDITMSEMLDGIKPGDVISDPAFLSTSSDKNIALRKFGPGVMTDNGPTLDASNPVYEPSSFWAIRVPKGSKALAAPEDSYFSEKEVLLPRNTQLRIDGIKKVAQVEEGGENGSFNYYIEASVIPVSNVSEPLDPPRIDVPEQHKWKVESNFGVDDYYNKVVEKIHSELGYYVSNLPFSKEYNILEGQTFAKKNTKIKKVKGLVGENNCWQNVAEAIRQGWDGDVYLGFSADEGASRGSGHAWLVKDGEVLETTHLAREVYYGKKLSEEEKKQFLAEWPEEKYKESEKSGGSSKDGNVEFFDDSEQSAEYGTKTILDMYEGTHPEYKSIRKKGRENFILKSLNDAGISDEDFMRAMWPMGSAPWSGKKRDAEIKIVKSNSTYFNELDSVIKSKSMSEFYTYEEAKNLLEAAQKDVDPDSRYYLVADIDNSSHGAARAIVSSFFEDWSGSSSRSEGRYAQAYVKNAFNLKNTYDTFFADYAGGPLNTLPNLDLDDAKTKVSIALVRAQYEYTQKVLKDLGIKKLIVYRGMHNPTDKEITTPTITSIDSRPLSSWSVSEGVPAYFATPKNAKGKEYIVMRKEIPVEEVFSLAWTGMGMGMNDEGVQEAEVVLLGGRSDVKAVGIKEFEKNWSTKGIDWEGKEKTSESSKSSPESKDGEVEWIDDLGWVPKKKKSWYQGLGTIGLVDEPSTYTFERIARLRKLTEDDIKSIQKELKEETEQSPRSQAELLGFLEDKKNTLRGLDYIENHLKENGLTEIDATDAIKNGTDEIFDKPENKLTDEEKEALLAYKGIGYIKINEFLRKPDVSVTGAKKVQSDIKNIDAAFEKQEPTTAPKVLSRGISGKAASIFSRLTPGDIYEESGFMSTTSSWTTANNFAVGTKEGRPALLTIIAPAGSKLLRVWKYTPSTYDEGEFLLPRGSKLKITSVEKSDVTYVEAELVLDDAPETEKSGDKSSDGEVTWFDDGKLDPKAEGEKYRSDRSILNKFESDKKFAESYEEILEIDRKRVEWLKTNGVTVRENGDRPRLITFTPEEIKNAYNYIPEGGIFAAEEMSEEQGKEFNRRMKALANIKRPGSTSDETIEGQNKLNGEGATPIKVKELRHSAPAYRFDEIMANGIKPKATNKVGGENYTRRRFGVFLANDYTSSEAGERADVFRVKVPENDLRVDSGYTPFGQNLYIERTVKPEELEHIGHYPVGEGDLHSGRGAECKDCDLAEKERQEDEQKRKEKEKEKYSTPVLIYQLKFSGEGGLAPEHAVHYKSGADEFHRDHSIEDCPETVKNPGVVVRPNGLEDDETVDGVVEAAKPASESKGMEDGKGEVTWFDDEEPLMPKNDTVMVSESGRKIKPGETVNFSIDDESIPFKYTGTEFSDILDDPSDAPSIGIYDGIYIFELNNSPDEEKVPNGFYTIFSDDITPEDPNDPFKPIELIQGHNQFIGTEMPIRRSTDEQLALDAYSSTFYREINPALNRGEDVSKLERLERSRKFTGDQILANLDSFIDRSTLSEDTTLWRGISTNDPKYKNFLKSLQPGDVIKDNSFTSTSRDKGQAGMFLEKAIGGIGADDLSVEFKINAKKGTKAANVFRSALGPSNLEKEVLLPRGNKMTDSLVVTKVEKDKYNPLFLRVELDYVPTSTSKEEPAPEKKKGIEPGFKNWNKQINDIFTAVDENEDTSKGNPLQLEFIKKAGFNGKPRVLSQQEFDAIEGETIYRGLTSPKFKADYIKSETQFASEGYFGNGTYATNKKETTASYIGFTETEAEAEKHTLEMKFLPDANVLSFEEATDLREWADQKTREFLEEYEKSGANPGEVHDAEWRLFNESDYTNIAIMLGIDAIRFKVPLTDKEEYYTIILNRGKVAINGKS